MRSVTGADDLRIDPGALTSSGALAHIVARVLRRAGVHFDVVRERPGTSAESGVSIRFRPSAPSAANASGRAPAEHE